jgi:N-acetylglutamate synthase-like GNAT family acetyltransferase
LSTIAPARVDDLPAIRRLLAACALPHDDFRDDAVAFLVARDAGRIQGVAGIEALGEVALLRSVAVPPENRRRGLARSLCDAALAHARSIGVQHVYLLTTAAEPYFRRLGFVTIDRDSLPAQIRSTSEFLIACPQSATAMEKALKMGLRAPIWAGP